MVSTLIFAIAIVRILCMGNMNDLAVGTILLGLSKIVDLLEDIKRKINKGD